ncbi:hypothetical protein BDP27DRAFT_1376849 [Rhodocollybia butyracea]|uniref:Uncharacterized protein n=1 Tax=Rhodocollybia butyracea TaxID=206335 RepID=A0A9P5P4Y3_9AGAR|nr:hypothetical protein BDP27DRAFT_1376849 [Rhodocollybia butyracea]
MNDPGSTVNAVAASNGSDAQDSGRASATNSDSSARTATPDAAGIVDTSIPAPSAESSAHASAAGCRGDAPENRCVGTSGTASSSNTKSSTDAPVTHRRSESSEDEEMVLWKKGLLVFDQEVSTCPAVPLRSNTGDASEEESSDDEGVSQKKKAVMGDAECQAAKSSAVEKQKMLFAAVEQAMLGLEKEFEKIAAENHVKQLALINSPIKQKKEVSDWNVMLYFKGQEMNEGKAKGSRFKLSDIQEALRNNPVFSAIRDDPKKMGEYCQRYLDEKKDEANSKVHRLTPKALSQAALKSLSLLQCDYVFEHSGSNTFGVITRSAFDIHTPKGFFGTGPADDFLQETFNVTMLGFAELFDAFVCKQKELHILGKKKLSAAKMTKATVLMIQQGLCTITGVNNLSISYSKFIENIVIPYKITLKGWPADIPHVSPQSLTKTEDILQLYKAWMDGMAYWHKMTNREYSEFITEHDVQIGKSVKALKKGGASEKKKKHARVETDSDDAEERNGPGPSSRTSKGMDAATKESGSVERGLRWLRAEVMQRVMRS